MEGSAECSGGTSAECSSGGRFSVLPWRALRSALVESSAECLRGGFFGVQWGRCGVLAREAGVLLVQGSAECSFGGLFGVLPWRAMRSAPVSDSLARDAM